MDKAAKKLAETTSAVLDISAPTPAAMAALALLEKASEFAIDAAGTALEAAKDAGECVRFHQLLMPCTSHRSRLTPHCPTRPLSLHKTTASSRPSW
jgi:uncharacterized protein involved in outer membrane biogenesis